MLDESMRFLLDEFVAEAKEHLSHLEEDLMEMERLKDNPESELVNRVFRAIHTVKGTSGFFGFEKITTLSHTMENILSLIRNNEMIASSNIVDALLKGADLISTMVDDCENSNDTDIAGIEQILKSILETGEPQDETNVAEEGFSLLDDSGVDTGFSIDPFMLTAMYERGEKIFVLSIDLIELAKTGNASPMKIIGQLLKIGEIIEAKIMNTDDDLMSGLPISPLSYRALFSTKLSKEELLKSSIFSSKSISIVQSPFETNDSIQDGDNTSATLVSNFPESEDEIAADNIETSEKSQSESPAISTGWLDNLAPKPTQSNTTIIKQAPEAKPEPEKAEAPEKEKLQKIGQESTGSIRISVDILDDLMRLASELVLVRNQQLRNTNNADSNARNIMQRLDVVTTELQETIMLTRMQPIGNIFNKFQRIVRELGKKLGKQISISISGSEVELDKTILEALTDPLTHIIRNSCDHGIESPADREAAGKLPMGSLMLNAWHEGGQINIELIDDGKGIDPEVIRRKAVEKGMKTRAEIETLSDRDVIALVMLPGFSTADKISDVSGRGVGMDVVKSGIEKLNGTIDIDSEKGYGTQIRLRLPLTLAIIPCLIVSVDDVRYAIPQVNLEELVSLYDSEVYTKIECAGDREVYRLRDQLLPMIRLNEILKRSEKFTEEVILEITDNYRAAGVDNINNENQSLNFAVLTAGTRKFGIIVDKVLGTEEIVVKPMHSTLKNLHIYSGTTVMGDGGVALILDVEGLLQHSGISSESTAKGLRNIKEEEIESVNEEKQTLLLFKSGANESFAVALPLIKRIERIKMDKIEHLGVKEFITIGGVSTRVLRLDKVLSISHFQDQEEGFLLLPKHIKRPFGILASKLVDIEETDFQLNTESYVQDGLLGTAIIREKMTLFIDIYRLIELSEPDWFDERRKSTPPPSEAKKILLVEDSSFFRELVKGYLESDGYSVTTAADGSLALKQIALKKFDLVVSDLEMPVMDGFEFIKILKSDPQYKGLYTIALTALDNDKDRQRALSLGFEKYEVKLERENFLTTVAQILHTQRKTRAEAI